MRLFCHIMLTNKQTHILTSSHTPSQTHTHTLIHTLTHIPSHTPTYNYAHTPSNTHTHTRLSLNRIFDGSWWANLITYHIETSHIGQFIYYGTWGIKLWSSTTRQVLNICTVAWCKSGYFTILLRIYDVISTKTLSLILCSTHMKTYYLWSYTLTRSGDTYVNRRLEA